MFPARPTLMSFFLGSCCLACGAGATDSKTASDASQENGGGESGDDSSESLGEGNAGPNCDDGTCFPCGEGICPLGAYCDQDAEGGAACAWLSECAGTPSCACVTKVLGNDCSCDQVGQGASVSCQ